MHETEENLCYACDGTGLGHYDGASCRKCHGTGLGIDWDAQLDAQERAAERQWEREHHGD